MNLAKFIASRLNTSGQKSFSKLIVRIAITAIALSITVMILSTSIVRGFKNTISEKVFGFWGHIHISGFYGAAHMAFEPRPISKNQPFYPFIDTVRQVNKSPNPDIKDLTKGGIKHIQVFGSKEGIIKTSDQIEGIILKGISTDFDWSFLKNYLLEGDTLTTTDAIDVTDGILISDITAKRLNVKVGDKFDIYFVQQGDALARRFKIQGIYKTGLEEYDRRFALVDIRQIQQLNNWRPFYNYGTELVLPEENAVLVAMTAATEPSFFESFLVEGTKAFWDDSLKQEAIVAKQIAASKNWKLGDSISLKYFTQDEISYGIQDSALLKFKIVGIHDAQNLSDQSSTNWQNVIFVGYDKIQRLNYMLPEQVSGFEVFVENLDDLDDLGAYTENDVLMGLPLYSNTIKQIEPAIFDWLNLTNMNERIILIIMLGVAIINMTTSLLILILERTNMIGTLKALGANNWIIRKIFLYYAAYIIIWGLIVGNILGIGLALIQKYFGIIKLPEDLYYVAVAPIELNIPMIIALNIGTLIITLLVLILPSYLVARIDPVKAIRFK